MTATTPKRALTYVTPTDKPQVYPAASKALADTLDALLGVAGSVCTAGPKFTANGAIVYRVAGLLVVNLNLIANSAAVAGDILLTMPAGNVPVVLFFGTVVNTSNETNVRVHMDVDRTIKIQTPISSGITVRGTVVGTTA